MLVVGGNDGDGSGCGDDHGGGDSGGAGAGADTGGENVSVGT